jgi:arylsulfatase A-like enzyme
VHLDGYNFLPYFTGQEEKGPRREIFYFSDTGDLTALRYNDWKAIIPGAEGRSDAETMEKHAYVDYRVRLPGKRPLRPGVAG